MTEPAPWRQYDGRPWLVLGSGGHARTMLECITSNGHPAAGVVDIRYHGQREDILGVPVVGGLAVLETRFSPREVNLVIGVGDNQFRKGLFLEMIGRGYSLPPLVHARAFVSDYCTLGQGTQVAAGALINSEAAIAENTIVNTGAIVEHEVRVGAHSHLAPGVRLGGRAVLGEGCFLGIGTCVINRISIGAGVVVGAASLVLKDLPAGCRAWGSPCRIAE